ncbi:MAG: transporter substrate-binding domain-containing protein [Bulleidia sp.]
MKKWIQTGLAAVMMCTMTACGQKTEDDHLARIQSAGKLIVGLEGDWQPFSFHDKDDVLRGVDVEVAQEIAKRIGVEAEIVEGKWDGLLTGLSTGTYDIVVNGVDITEEREKTFDFSDPYIYDRTVLVIKEGTEGITSFEDLKGRTTANSIGSTYMEMGESYGAEVQGVDDLTKCMDMVKNGTVDATINASTSINDYITTTGETCFQIVDESDTMPYAIPMKKGEDNDSLRAAINTALKSMRDDGTLKAISEKYFGSDLTNE